mgnify:CR=1 FL=1
MLTSKIFCGILFFMNTNKNTDNEMMNTQVKKVDAMHPDMDIMREAGEIIRQGGLVGFPTETVYGLGADALLPEGAKRIYAAKGRPSDNPLIVHIADFEALKKITSYIPPQAKALADALQARGVKLVSGGTDNHLMLIDLRDEECTLTRT